MASKKPIDEVKKLMTPDFLQEALYQLDMARELQAKTEGVVQAQKAEVADAHKKRSDETQAADIRTKNMEAALNALTVKHTELLGLYHGDAENAAAAMEAALAETVKAQDEHKAEMATKNEAMKNLDNECKAWQAKVAKVEESAASHAQMAMDLAGEAKINLAKIEELTATVDAMGGTEQGQKVLREKELVELKKRMEADAKRYQELQKV